MNALGYATSDAHGCNDCQIHSASVADDASAGYAKGIEVARNGDYSGDFGPFEAALPDLAAKASTNTVADDDLAKVRKLRPGARITKLPIEPKISAAAMIASVFGFLNVFNDLTGVKVEAMRQPHAATVGGLIFNDHGRSGL